MILKRTRRPLLLTLAKGTTMAAETLQHRRAEWRFAYYPRPANLLLYAVDAVGGNGGEPNVRQLKPDWRMAQAGFSFDTSLDPWLWRNSAIAEEKREVCDVSAAISLTETAWVLGHAPAAARGALPRGEAPRHV